MSGLLYSRERYSAVAAPACAGRDARHTAMTMESLIVNQQGTGLKQVAYFVLVAAAALAAPVPAAMAGPGEGEILQEDDGYQPILPDVGGRCGWR
jgi:hypothetical protein